MNYRIEKKRAFRIVGTRMEQPHTSMEEAEAAFAEVPKFWAKSETAIPLIQKLADGAQDAPQGLLGVSTCDESEGAPNFYCIAVASEKPVPPGMHEFTVPEATWAIFPGKGKSEQLQELQMRIVSEWLPTSGYEWAKAPDIEVYLEGAQFEVWLPVKAK
jgi:AraC family transcriptional regulator